MEIGLSSASFYPNVNTEDSIEVMKQLGFESGEIFLNSPSEYEEDFIKELLEEKNKYNFKIILFIVFHPLLNLIFLIVIKEEEMICLYILKKYVKQLKY